ncbi:MAG: FAD-dependent oxidoreductase [Planctomycetota bacterium]
MPDDKIRFDRDTALKQIRQRSDPWDVIIIGGGATGVAAAMDAASRNLHTLLVERFDFGQGTSSRSTKLVHGGVRYLQQGNLTLVRDALQERSLLARNAPHTVHALPFIIPCANWFSRLYYWIGLKLYDLLGRSAPFTRSRALSADAVEKRLPTLRRQWVRGGVQYSDGQFDDARLLIDMASTAAEQGGCLVNHANVTNLRKDHSGRIIGVQIRDEETGLTADVQGRAVINATGPFCDAVRQRDLAESEPLVAASQGVHLTLPKRFFPGDAALMIPKTSDGRVLFVIPWLDHVLVGTTDTAIPEAVAEPQARQQEIDFLLSTAGEYLNEAPSRTDVLSVFVGIRPLVMNDPSARTASLSRDHQVVVSDTGLISITGGKWTTVRKMAEDVIDRAIQSAGLTGNPCVTKDLHITATREKEKRHLAITGAAPAAATVSEKEVSIEEQRIHANFPETTADVIRAVRFEMARTVEDFLARRSRALFLNASASVEMAPRVASIMAEELKRDQQWEAQQVANFAELAATYHA